MGRFETRAVGDTTVTMGVAGQVALGSAGVVVFHAWWGLNDDVIAFADRLAAAGFVVVAPDCSAARWRRRSRKRSGCRARPTRRRSTTVALAAIDLLAEDLGPNAKLAALGFSFGAHWAIWSPAQRDRVVASVVYYGTTGDTLTDSQAPVLGHFAETDPYESDEWVAEFAATMRTAGRDVEIHRYPGTGHWFAEPSKPAYRPAAADLAFERTVAFLRAQLDEPPDR